MHVCPDCGASSARSGFCPADGNALAPANDPLLGTEILRYRLARAIGEGGMGKVYLAVQPQIGSRVAIKVLSAQCASNPDLLERFFSEGRAVNLIRHESIVGVIDLAQLDDGRPLIIMEYIDGVTLSKIVRDGRAPLGWLVRAVLEVLAALEAAHAIGIVHRDIKPDNILVTANGHAKVLDFGIAKLAPELSHAMSPRTRTGAMLGTPSYMAPEQISGTSAIDGRTDVYAVGVLLFEAVTGRLPFVGATLFDLMRAHLEQPPPSPRALRSEAPARARARDPHGAGERSGAAISQRGRDVDGDRARGDRVAAGRLARARQPPAECAGARADRERDADARRVQRGRRAGRERTGDVARTSGRAAIASHVEDRARDGRARRECERGGHDPDHVGVADEQRSVAAVAVRGAGAARAAAGEERADSSAGDRGRRGGAGRCRCRRSARTGRTARAASVGATAVTAIITTAIAATATTAAAATATGTNTVSDSRTSDARAGVLSRH